MAVIIERRYSEAIHPVHAVLLAGAFSLFLAAALSDLTYSRTFEIQWINFAAWLIAGGLVFAGIALVFVIIDLCRAHRRVRGIGPYAVLVLVMWIVGFFNALMHARDAWASMPAGLVLSAITVVIGFVALWLGFHTARIGDTR